MRIRRVVLAAVALGCGFAFTTIASDNLAVADEIGQLLPGESAVDSGSNPHRIEELRSRIASLEERIAILESVTVTSPASATEACGQAVPTTDSCCQAAAATTTTSRVVVRRYLVPLGTTILPVTNSSSALSVQGLGLTGAVSGVSAFAAPTTYAAPATFAAPVGLTTLGAPSPVFAPAGACSNVASYTAGYDPLGTTYSTWGAYPTTVYRGVGSVYSNSYSGAALNTGSGVSFYRVR